MSIASNHCIDRIRKRRMQFVSIDEPIPATLSLASDDPQPERATEMSEQSQRIQALLETLDEDYRLAVVLRYWYDYSYAEIAETMETTESAIKSRLFRARQMLAARITSDDVTEDTDRLSRLT
jgi:RNA polymerase sigma-70 factor (ECF subfamily)